MTVAEQRGDGACLAPVVIDHVLDEPDLVRELARSGAPYGFQARPGSLVWPTWRAQWASDGEVHRDGARVLLEHDGFRAAAARMCGCDAAAVVPHGLYINLSTPFMAQPVSHVDMPEFVGFGGEEAPDWFLQAMGVSGLFEAERIPKVTAVSWFSRGLGGAYRYWPHGRDHASVRHDRMWNTAVVGDNDYMHHQVEKVGKGTAVAPPTLTPASVLDFETDSWSVRDDERVLADVTDEDVRLSLSWTAHIDEPGSAEVEALTRETVFVRLREAWGPGFAADAPDALFGDASRVELMSRWPGFRPL